MKILWLVVGGLVCTVLTEVMVPVLFLVVPPGVDMVSAFFTFTAPLAGLISVGLIAGVLLGPRLARGPLWHSVLFGVVYLGSHSLLLSVAGNPPTDRLRYLAVLVIALVAVLTAVRLAMRRPAREGQVRG